MTITSNISTITVTGRTIVIAKDGSGNYTKIQEGINASNPGDIVYVKNGTYPEKITVNKSIQLLGQDKRYAIIDGSPFAFPGSTWETGLVKIVSNNVLMSQFKVQNMKGSGIVAINADHLIVEKNYTYNTWGSGIQVHNGNDIKVRYNEVEKANMPDDPTRTVQEQISFAGPNPSTRGPLSGFEIAYNYIHDGGNTQYGGESLVIKQGCQNGICHHNYILKPVIPHTGIYVDSQEFTNKNIIVEKNLMELTKTAMSVTTEQAGTCDDIAIRENIMYHNYSAGFATPNTSRTGIISNLTIKDNIIYKNGPWPELCPEHPYKSPGIWLGRSSFQNLPTYSNVLIQNNDVCNNCLNPQITIDPRIPSSAYVVSGNHTEPNCISQTDFNAKYDALKNDILGSL